MKEESCFDLNIDVSDIKNHAEYVKLWEKVGRLKITCVKVIGECKHKEGEVFYYENPVKKPEGVCYALLHSLDLFTWRTAFGFPSWNSENRKKYKIHCPDAEGTIWEMEKA